MLNNRLIAAKMVVENLHAFEDAIDQALICAGELAVATAKARVKANISAVTVQDAVARTGNAMAALYEARAQIVAAHHEFATVRDEMGLTPRMTGDLWKFVKDDSEQPMALQSVG